MRWRVERRNVLKSRWEERRTSQIVMFLQQSEPEDSTSRFCGSVKITGRGKKKEGCGRHCIIHVNNVIIIAKNEPKNTCISFFSSVSLFNGPDLNFDSPQSCAQCNGSWGIAMRSYCAVRPRYCFAAAAISCEDTRVRRADDRRKRVGSELLTPSRHS